jgi:hypothetical protein
MSWVLQARKERNKHAAELQAAPALPSSALSLAPASPALSHPPQSSNVPLHPAATNIPIKPTLAATAGATFAAAFAGSGSFMIALASNVYTGLWLLAWPLRVLMAAACAAVKSVATLFCAIVAAACWIVQMALTSLYVMMTKILRGVWTLVSAPYDLLAALLPRRVAQPGPAQLELPPTKKNSSLQYALACHKPTPQKEAPASRFHWSASGFPSLTIAASAVSQQVSCLVSSMADVALRRDFAKLAKCLSLKDKVSCLACLRLFNRLL